MSSLPVLKPAEKAGSIAPCLRTAPPVNLTPSGAVEVLAVRVGELGQVLGVSQFSFWGGCLDAVVPLANLPVVLGIARVFEAEFPGWFVAVGHEGSQVAVDMRSAHPLWSRLNAEDGLDVGAI